MHIRSNKVHRELYDSMIQLLTKEGKVLYELEQSEMFPDYCSVLKEAIALNINLKELYVDSENIDEVVWQGNNLDKVTFLNCSMRKNVFRECAGEVTFKRCNLQRLKINKSDFDYLNPGFCDLTSASIRNSSLKGSSFDNCILEKAVFFNCKAKRLWVGNCNLTQALFENCNLNNSLFYHSSENSDWYSETKFIKCKMKEVEMQDITELSNLFFWDADINSIRFEDEPKITEITNTYSKVVFAVRDKVIWWKPFYYFGEVQKIPFKCSPEDFIKEVESGYPATGIDPDGADDELDDELRAVCNYLKFWL